MANPADMRAALGVLIALLVTSGSAATAAPTVALLPPQTLFVNDAVTKSDNVHFRASFSYKGATDIDFSDGIAYASVQGDRGGVHVIDVRGPDPKELAFVPCPGTQNDVAVIKPGLIALGFIGGACGRDLGGGMRLINVSDPARPRYLGGVGIPDGAHTLTVFPGKPLVYLSPGGVGENDGEQFVVDVSDPRNPKIVHRFTPDPMGCHDVSFNVRRKLGFCPGQLGTEIWDVSDPAHPAVITRIPSIMEFPHSAIASDDGNLLVISDESYVAHDCTTGHSPFGALYAYDISNPAVPIFKGSISSPRGATPIGNLALGICGAHNFNFVPNTRKVVSSWYTGGTSVVDFSDASAPKELAYYRPDGANVWSSYFHRGYVFVSDMGRGLELLTVDGLPQPPPPPQPEPEPEEPKEPKDPEEPEEPEEPEQPECDVTSADEQRMANKINGARERRDVRELKLDQELSFVAAAHSRAMRREQRLYHSPERQLRERVTRWEILGENVGRGRSVDTLHEAFMESEPHRHNVTNGEYRHLGIGIAEDGNQIWITILFEAYEDPGTTMDMPKGC